MAANKAKVYINLSLMLQFIISQQGFYFCEEFRDEKFLGIFLGRRPCLLVKDLDLIKKILIKHFDYFADRSKSSLNSFPSVYHHFKNNYEIKRKTNYTHVFPI